MVKQLVNSYANDIGTRNWLKYSEEYLNSRRFGQRLERTCLHAG